MPTDKIETLVPGTEFVANYKKTRYTATVREDGIYVFPAPLTPGPFKTLSGAGRAVMGGIACNGWRFWSPANGEPTVRTAKAARHPDAQGFREGTDEEFIAAVEADGGTVTRDATAPRPRLARQIKRVPNQKGVEEGKTRWFCSACMAGFQEETGITPATCPQGHLALVPDEFTGVSE